MGLSSLGAPGRGACCVPGRSARQDLRGARRVELREILCLRVLRQDGLTIGIAERGRTAEGPEICPCPQKYGSFWLRVRLEIRRFTAECGKTLTRDSAPNRIILEEVAGSNVLRAVRKRTTVFVTDLFDRDEGNEPEAASQLCGLTQDSEAGPSSGGPPGSDTGSWPTGSLAGRAAILSLGPSKRERRCAGWAQPEPETE
jgi:hypothetical protein